MLLKPQVFLTSFLGLRFLRIISLLQSISCRYNISFYRETIFSRMPVFDRIKVMKFALSCSVVQKFQDAHMSLR